MVLWLWKPSRDVFSHTLLLLLYFMGGNWLHLQSHERLGWGVPHCQPGTQGQGMEETDGLFTVVHGGRRRHTGIDSNKRGSE